MIKLEKKTMYTLAAILFGAIFFAWVLENTGAFFEDIGFVLGLFSPMLVGFCIAFVLNVPMRFLERHLFTKTQRRPLQAVRRPLALVISLCFIAAVLALIVELVVPELISAFTVLGDSVGIFFQKAQTWGIANAEAFPELKTWLSELQLNWMDIGKTALGFVTSGASGILAGITQIVVGFTGGIMQFIIAFIFAIYILLGKETLKRQLGRLLKAFMPARVFDGMYFVSQMSAKTFASFVTGQCTEACILGILCWLGMLLLQFPYAPMIGALVGASALIPIVGAFVGTVVGGFMILMTGNVMQAVGFVIFLLILQQIEGNVIYPRVVGSSVGLPGLWVLAAVTVGGSLFGIGGMLFAVPVCSVAYALLRLVVRHRLDGAPLLAPAEIAQAEAAAGSVTIAPKPPMRKPQITDPHRKPRKK